MKQSEALRVMAELCARFPSHKLEKEHIAGYCAEILDLHYQRTLLAVKLLARTEDWFPSIARIRRAYAAQEVQASSGADLWMAIMDACNHTGYGKYNLDGVPSEVRRAVKFLGGWRQLGQLSHSDLQIARAHILKYAAQAKEQRIREIAAGDTQRKLK